MKHLLSLAKVKSTSGVQEKEVEGEVSLVRGTVAAVVPDEAMVKVGETEESLEFFKNCGFEPLCQSLDLYWIHPHLATFDNIP